MDENLLNKSHSQTISSIMVKVGVKWRFLFIEKKGFLAHIKVAITMVLFLGAF